MAKARRSKGQLVVYNGADGRVFKARYTDANRKRVQETLGRESEGMTPSQARDKLHDLLTAVRNDKRKKLEPTTFKRFAEGWIDERDDEGELKRSTRLGYRLIIETHLVPAFGSQQLDQIDVDDLEAYKVQKRKDGLAGSTVNRHLNLLHKLYVAAGKRRLARSNPVAIVDRPREPRRHWRILTPLEIGRVERAFTQLGKDAWIRQARVVFLTAVGIGLRRGEILGLRWKDVALADPEGARLRVRETWVVGGTDTPKSQAGERTIALGKVLADELFQHRQRTAYAGDDDRVFCHPLKGSPLDPARYAETFRAALKKAGITDYVRPFHDQRHSSITLDALAGVEGMALMKRAGHSDFATTQLYIDLAGETFREEAELADARKFGHNSRHNPAEVAGRDENEDQ